jgi:hypothetical protein
MLPLVALVLLAIIFFVPARLKCGCFRGSQNSNRMQRSFWRVFLYLLFLVFPGVSSTVLSHYICKEIDGNYFLLTDLRVRCYTDQWTVYAFASVALVLLYPVGIPLFFFALLQMHKGRLDDPPVRAQLSFLYEGYRRETWYFELVSLPSSSFFSSFLKPSYSFLPSFLSVCRLIWLTNCLPLRF